jgi:hypothetical protein
MLNSGTIDQAMHDAGRDFQAVFVLAQLPEGCGAALDDRFRIEEQKSAVATATAARDPELPGNVKRFVSGRRGWRGAGCGSRG